MTALSYDLIIEAGATFDDIGTWRDSTGALVNTTGYTARLQIRSAVESTVVILELTNGSGITLGGAAGTIEITIPAATTTGYATGLLGVYDLLVTAPDTVTKYRLLEGNARVHPAVTR